MGTLPNPPCHGCQGTIRNGRCRARPLTGTVRARVLFADWSGWCHANGEALGSEVAFAEAMGRRGFAKKRSSTGQIYAGLALLAADEDGNAW